MDPAIDLCEVPAGVSPNGVYNFINPPTLVPAMLGISIALGTISTLLVAGRLFVNRQRLRSADYVTFLACLSNIAYTGAIDGQLKFFRHSWDIRACWYTGDSLKLTFVQVILFCPVFLLSKTAIFLFYRQVFATGKRLRLAVDIGIVITTCVYLTEIPLAAIYAAPRPGHSWASFLTDLVANQRPFTRGGIVQSSITIALDIYLFILPLPILSKLKMAASRRWQLMAVFSTALLGVGASIATLYFKIRILTATDVTWSAALSTMCTLIETNIALIVGCMPAFSYFTAKYITGSSFIKSLRSRLLPSTRNSSKVISNDHQPPELTFGGGKQNPRQKNYYELTDSMLLKTQGTLQGDPEEDRESKRQSDQTITGDPGQAV